MQAHRTIIGAALVTCASGWTLWASPAGAAPATVLVDRVEQANAANRAEASIEIGPFGTDALVHATASGRSTYSGPSGSAGIIVSVLRNLETLAEDDSFEGQASSVTFRASVSQSFVVRRGTRVTVYGRTNPYGSHSAGNRSTSVRLSVVAIAAD